MLKAGRLTKQVRPLSYDVKLDVIMDEVADEVNKFSYTGIVKTDVHFCNFTGQQFAMHSVRLQINTIKVDDVQTTFSFDEKSDLVIINIPEQLLSYTGNKLVEINFVGKITKELKGFYLSEHTFNNTTNYIATTQFEPTDARKAFPCFDEPNFKALFNITITADADRMVLSNMQIKSEIMNMTDGNNRKTTTFNTTPLMSTYLVAFIIGNFDYVEQTIEKYNDDQDKNASKQTKIRVYGTSDNKDKMNFALDVTCRSLIWYEQWFGINYPLPKLDMIGIPDFNSGAMENWGLITFRPELLFCNDSTVLSAKEDVVITICHELAHQWFGNLVTMDWWEYLWLNESMATYFGWLVCDQLFPLWNIWDKFEDMEFAYAFNLDGLASSHPIEVKIDDARNVNEIFDGISYSKGSCLVRFLTMYLGKNKFRDGMRQYMNDNKWKNTTSIDLWNAFSTQTKDDTVLNIMKDWTSQMGYPVITVSKTDKGIKLQQNKYLKTGPNTDPALWIIPVQIYVTDDQETADISILMNKTKEMEIQGNFKQVIVNPDREGFYRVMYDNIDINMEELHISTQKQIVSDLVAMCFTGYQSISKFFSVITKIDISSMTNYNFLSTILSNTIRTYTLLKNHSELQLLVKRYIEKYQLRRVI